MLALVLALLPVGSSTALSDSEYSSYSQNSIYFYDSSIGNIDRCDEPVLGRNVTWIGDSYSVGASNYIMEKLDGVDLGNFNSDNPNADQPSDSYIKVSKFVESGNENNPGGISILRSIVDEEKLRPYLVFALGNNGGITEAQVRTVMRLAGDNTKVVFVNMYMATTNSDTQSYIRSSNEVLADAADEYNNVRIADWASVARDEYYSNDSSGVHPSSGYEEWVNVIYRALSSFNSGVNGTTVGENQNYAGDTVWTEEQLGAINANRTVYEKAEQEYGIPWQAMATMHSLETGLARTNPANGQGIYQLYSYTDGGTNSNAFVPAGPVSEEEFERQTLIAAEQMKRMIESKNLEVNSNDGIKSLMFQYNGMAPEYINKALAMGFSQEEAEFGEGSPYVMNRYDARRDPGSPDMDSHWPGRFVGDGVYDEHATQSDFGGFVKYTALTGGVCNGGGNMDLNASAIELAWPEAEAYKSAIDPKPEYVRAMESTGIRAEADPNNDGIWDAAPRRMGMSCDMFVGTVVRYSGVDPSFPYSLGNQKTYLDESDMWDYLLITDSSQYKAGDIRIEYDGGHITMVVEVDGELKIASASAFSRFGDIGSFYPGDLGSSTYGSGNPTYRLKR